MLSTTFTGLLAVVAASISSANAHGYVQGILVDGADWYSGYLPYSDPYYDPPNERIVRPVPGNGPVEDLTLIDVQCNGYTAGGVVGSEPAAIYATAAAGSSIDLQWTDWPDSHVGPIITYLAKASNGDVTSYEPGTDAVWFKIAEEGKTSDGLWAATDILGANNWTSTVTIPSTLQAGQYIMRHEILALHAAYSYPGVQVYPSCIQFEITGSGSAFPTSFVSFPGAYTADTPGIVYDAYTETGEYPIPGPDVWSG